MYNNAEWIEKYGIDFIVNYGSIDRNSIMKLLNIDINQFYIYKNMFGWDI